MATVAELSEPYRNHLIPVPRLTGVSAAPAGRQPARTSACAFSADRAARNEFHQGLADAVVPIALAVKREQLAHELRHYKFDVDAGVRAQLTMRLGAVLWRFLGQHDKRIAEAASVPEFAPSPRFPGRASETGAPA
jgi:hypothetical protein